MQELKNSYIVTIYDGLSKKHTLDEIKHQLAIDTLNSEVKQGLHFEMYKNGAVINPEKFYDKSVKDLTNN